VPLRTVFDVIARAAGLNFLFDKDVPPTEDHDRVPRRSRTSSSDPRHNQLEQKS